MDKAEKRAIKALGKILNDGPAWSAALGLLQARAIRDDMVLIRLEKGLSQEQVAERIGISVKRLQEIESMDWPDLRLSTLRRWNMAIGARVQLTLEPSLKMLIEEMQKVDETQATFEINVPEELRKTPRPKPKMHSGGMITKDPGPMLVNETVKASRLDEQGNDISETWDIGVKPGDQVIHNVHPRVVCSGHACCIHNPSDHLMKDFPLNWRDDRGIMERICPHGIGHPDPDDAAYRAWVALDGEADTVHGCDGCCSENRIRWEGGQ